jgi:dolichol-phosphate mannosyltransferase
MNPMTTEMSLMSRAKDVCILLPVLNEVTNIGPLLDRIMTTLDGCDYLICIVDDGSQDGTAEYIRDAIRVAGPRLHLIERKKTMRGSQRGSALFAAMMWALNHTDCRILVEMDGDLSHRPEELPKGLALVVGGADVAIASKYLSRSLVTNRPLGRRLLSNVCNFAVRMLISNRISDYSNGYRFYSRDAARRIAATKVVYASPIYLTEVMAIWMSHGLCIREFSSHYVGRNEGLSKMRFIDLFKAAIAIFEVAYRLHVRGFEKRVTQCRLNQQSPLTKTRS